MVLSTLHTDNALGAIPRLLDLGVPAAILAGNLRGVIAQRLMRKLSVHCRSMRPPTAQERAIFPVAKTPPLLLGVAEGCDACYGSGRRGRTMVAEIVEFSNTMTPEAMTNRADFATMWRHDLAKVCAGVIALADLAPIVLCSDEAIPISSP